MVARTTHEFVRARNALRLGFQTSAQTLMDQDTIDQCAKSADAAFINRTLPILTEDAVVIAHLLAREGGTGTNRRIYLDRLRTEIELRYASVIEDSACPPEFKSALRGRLDAVFELAMVDG